MKKQWERPEFSCAWEFVVGILQCLALPSRSYLYVLDHDLHKSEVTDPDHYRMQHPTRPAISCVEKCCKSCQRMICTCISSDTWGAMRIGCERFKCAKNALRSGPDVWQSVTTDKTNAKQGGLRIKRKYPGSFYFFKPLELDLPTYIIRHIPIYGNVTSSTWSLCPSTCPRCLTGLANPVSWNNVQQNTT